MFYEIVHPAFDKPLRHYEIVVHIDYDVVIIKQRQYRKHLLHGLGILTGNPIYLECWVFFGKSKQFSWNDLTRGYKLLLRQIQEHNIRLQCIIQQ